MFCNNCGKELADNVKFCKYCGQKMPETTVQVAATPVEASKPSKNQKSSGSAKLVLGIVIGILVTVLAVGGGFVVKKVLPGADEEQKAGAGNVAGEVADDSAIVEFQDPLVERCVRKTLGKSYDEEITEAECASIESLLIECKYDVSYTVNMSVAIPNYDVLCNYIDFCDLEYLTGLEELYIDNWEKFDLIVNMDAIKNCKELKKICMDYNPMMAYYSGDMPRGYRYLKDIFEELPKLEYVDLGYYVPEEFKEILQEDNSKLVIFDGENQKYIEDAKDPYHTYGRADVGYWKDAETVEDYSAGWEYVYDGSDEYGVNAKSMLEVGGLEEFENIISELPADTEDIILRINTDETIDFSVFQKFPNLKTLSIASTQAHILVSSQNLMTIENIAALKDLSDLYALNLAGVTGDFNELGELENLKSLSLMQCGYDSCEFLGELENLRELTVCVRFAKEDAQKVPDICAVVQDMPKLKYLSIYNTSDLKGIENAKSLETLRCWMNVDSLEYVGQCRSLENLILNSQLEDTLDLSPLEELNQLKIIASLASGKVSHVEKVLGLPNLTTVLAYKLETPESESFPAQMNGLIDQAVENKSLSYFCPIESYFDGDIPANTQIKDIRMDELWDEDIFDGVLQKGIHYPKYDGSSDSYIYRTYDEVYSAWARNGLYY